MLAYFSIVGIYLIAVYRNLLFFKDGSLYSGWITVWGDWAVHLAYANSLLYNYSFPPTNPLFSNTQLNYPILPDLLSAVLMKFGVSFPNAFIIPGFLFTFLSLILLYKAIFILSSSKKISILTTFIFLNSGGLGFLYKSEEFTRNFDQGVYWTSMLTSILIPQRGMAVALTLFLALNIYFIKYWQRKTPLKITLLMVIATATLPLIHAHTFFVSLGIWFLYLMFNSALTWKSRLGVFLALVISIIPSVLLFYIHLDSSRFIRFHPGWMAKSLFEIPKLIIINYGLSLPLAVLGFIKATKKYRIFFFPFGLVFIFAHLFIIQPWDWDNSKLIAISWIGISFMVAFYTTTLPKIIGILALCICVWSGFHDNLLLLNFEKNSNQLAGVDDIKTAEFIKANTMPSGIFLTSDNHNNLVAMLAGRSIVMGFTGWLWSYGIDYYPRKIDIDLIKQGQLDLLDKYNVEYVVIGPAERGNGFSSDKFQEKFKVIYDQNGYQVLKLIAPHPRKIWKK